MPTFTPFSYYEGQLTQHTIDSAEGPIITFVRATNNPTVSAPLAPVWNVTTGVYDVGSGWQDAVAAYITDDDLVRGSDTAITWPDAQTRLNFCTVRYLNESKNLKEDTVSWPTKSGNTLVYDTYLTEDSGIQSEHEEFATGVVSHYTALAKAEQIVRSSRANVSYSFSVNRDYLFLEPGDIIKLQSDVMGIPRTLVQSMSKEERARYGDLLVVKSVVPDSSGIIKVEASRFDAGVLAWNVADNELSQDRRVFNDELGQASALALLTTTTMLVNSPGKLIWTDAIDGRVIQYSVRIAKRGIPNMSTEWIELGTSLTGSVGFEIPVVTMGAYMLTVVARSATRTAPQIGWPVLSAAETIFGYRPSTSLRCYRRSLTLPLAPVNAVGMPNNTAGNAYYNFISKVFGPPDGWTVEPTPTGAPLYYSDAIAYDSGGDHVDYNIAWKDPVLFPLSELFTKDLKVYTRTVPVDGVLKPTGGSWTFPDGPLVVPIGNTTWSEEIPVGYARVYAVTALATNTQNVGVNTNTLQWSQPFVAIEEAALQTVDISFYQWNTTVPTTSPAITGKYTWITGLLSELAGSGLATWYKDVPPNPGVPGLKLATCKLRITAYTTDATTLFDMAGGVLFVGSSNGGDGTKSADAILYQWAVTVPSAPSGASTYTWSNGSTDYVDTAWKKVIPAEVAGMSLYEASVHLQDASSVTTSSVNWVLSKILPIAYSAIPYTQYYIDLGSPVIVKDSSSLGVAGAVTNVMVNLLSKTGTGVPTTLVGAVWTIADTTGAESSVNTPGMTSVSANVSYYTIRMYNNSSKTILLDTQTLAVVLKGSDAVTAMLTNDNITITTASDGTGGVYTGAISTLVIYKGATELSGFTYANTGTAGVVFTGIAGPTVTVTNLTTDTGYIDLIATSALTGSITKRFTLSKSKTGTTGNVGISAPVIKTAYAVSTATTLTSTGTSASGALPATGAGFVGGSSNPWATTSSSTSLTAGQYQYMTFGRDDGTTVTWDQPFLTTLKVGSLSAIGVNTGVLTVSDTLTIGAVGSIQNGKTSYGSTATGYYIGNGGTPSVHFGTATSYLKWSVADGLVTNGMTIRSRDGVVLFNSGDTPANSSLNLGVPLTNVPSTIDNASVTATTLGAIKTDLTNAPSTILNSNVTATGIGAVQTSLANAPAGILNSNVTATGIGAVQTSLANAPAGILNSNVTLASLGGATAASVAAKLDGTVGNVINTNFTLQTSGYSGGNGFALYNGGLTAKNGGVNTFVVDNLGNVGMVGTLYGTTGTFSGTLTASAINAVNTINIGGNAVTIPYSSFNPATIGVSNYSTTTIGSIVINTDVSTNFFITVSGDSSAYAQQNGGTASCVIGVGIDTTALSIYTSAAGSFTIAYSTLLTGSHTINVICQAAYNGNVGVKQLSIMAIGTKR